MNFLCGFCIKNNVYEAFTFLHISPCQRVLFLRRRKRKRRRKCVTQRTTAAQEERKNEMNKTEEKASSWIFIRWKQQQQRRRENIRSERHPPADKSSKNPQQLWVGWRKMKISHDSQDIRLYSPRHRTSLSLRSLSSLFAVDSEHTTLSNIFIMLST